MIRRLPLALPVAMLVLALAVSVLVAISLGAARLPLATVVDMLTRALTGGTITRDDFTDYAVVWNVRTPRVLMAVVAGAGLGAIGVATQALVRNPLADPFILGISSGASVGASAVVAWGALAGLGIWALSAASFAGAVVASVIVYSLARAREGLVPLRLILVGVVLSFGFEAVMSTIVFLEPRGDAARTVMFWMLGSLGAAHWGSLPIAAVAVVICLAWLALRARAMDVLALGDGSAASMGVDAHRLRRELFAVTVLGTGVLVAATGAIGFVGLVVPHIVRLVFGPGHRRVLVLAPLVGALFLVWVDVISRLVVAPRELPIGVVTAMIGVPVFVLLLRRRGYAFGGS